MRDRIDDRQSVERFSQSLILMVGVLVIVGVCVISAFGGGLR